MFSVRISPLLGLCAAFFASHVASDHVSVEAGRPAGSTPPVAGGHLPTPHAPTQENVGSGARFGVVGNPDESRLEASHRDNFFSAPPAGFQRLQLATADDLDLFRSHDADGGGDGEFVVANGPGGGERPTLAGGSSGGNGSGGSGSGGGSDQNNADDVTPAVEPTVGDSNPAFKETELVLDIPRADSPRGSMDDPLAGGAASPAGRASTESDLIPKHSPTLTEAVPEPTSWVLMILGFGLIGATLRGQKRTGLLA